MTEDCVQIIVDDRERDSGTITALAEMKGVAVRVERLSLGDYFVDGRLLFERKTLGDFALSVIDGRLFSQMIRLAGVPQAKALILEGTGKDSMRVNIRREAMQGALITATLILGIPVLRSKDPLETAHLMIYAAHQARVVAKAGLQRHGYRPRGQRKRQLTILQGLPGIGRDRALRLLENFGSVEAVVTASRADLQRVRGIGERIAEKIRWAVRERVQTFESDTRFPL
jgi:DNA excision repair protein ERCC-4